MAYDTLPSGVTEETPDNILLGAGTIHKGLAYDTTKSAWNFSDSLAGATSGGNKFEIVPEVLQLEIDGASVRTKGLDVKTGEKATLEVNFAELTTDIINSAIIGEVGTSTITGYDVIESKESIDDSDYWDNIAFVGVTVTGRPIIVILDNALCTSGLSVEGKKKDSATGKYTYECTQEITGNLKKLPYHIYYPTVSESSNESSNESESSGSDI